MLRLSPFASVLLAISCAATPRDITTPSGDIHGNVLTPLEIVGYGQFRAETGNLKDAKAVHIMEETVEVPLDTMFIIPVMQAWWLGYGELHPTEDPDKVAWRGVDHHYGWGIVSVWVEEIQQPTPGNPPKRYAKIRVQFYLGDDSGKRDWFGLANYGLIYVRATEPD